MQRPSPAAVAIVALFAASLAVSVPGVLRLRLDNSPAAYFVRDASRLAEYRRLEAEFGPTRGIRVAVIGGDLWTPAGLAYLAAVETTARDSPGVRQTAGLHSRFAWQLPQWPPADTLELRRRATRDPLVRGTGWIAARGGSAVVDVALEPTAGRSALDELERRLATIPPPAGTTWTLTGLPVVQRAFDEGLLRLVRHNLPILLLIASGMLLLALRDIRHLLPPLLFVAVVVGGLLGAIGFAGVALNSVNVILVPLLFVISVATAVHLQCAYARLHDRGERPATAVRALVRKKGWAVACAAVTTAIAFGSLALSPVPPIRSLGLWLAIGALWMLAVARILYPALLNVVSAAAARRPPHRRPALAARVAVAALGRRRTTLGLFALAALLLGAGASRLHQETGLLSYFPPSHPARESIEALDRSGLGAVAAELVVRLEPGAGQSFRDPVLLLRLARLGQRLRELPEIRGCVGAGELFESALAEIVVEGDATPSSRWLVLGLLQSSPATATLLDNFLDDEALAARLTLSLPVAGYRRIEPSLERAVALARLEFPQAEATVSGEFPLILAVQRHLLWTLAASLTLTLVCIALVLAIILRSPALTLRVLLPNLWPLAPVFGCMGWLGIPLDSATVMTAAVVLGLSVDDTFHTLAELRRSGPGAPPRLEAALKRVAPAHLLTSLVLLAGFVACAFSELAQNRRFCILGGIGVVAALAADLGLLPALLSRPGADPAPDDVIHTSSAPPSPDRRR